jgi:uncharacterized protein involved in high-affinity Fe2+ transport
MPSYPRLLLLAAAIVTTSGTALAAEYPIGAPALSHDMEIAALYLQPIEMEPAGMMRPAAESDIHLEADIHATADNRNGFAEGDWIPSLGIGYEITRQDSGERTVGSMMPMVASDGPHYGDNVKLMGPGAYRLRLLIAAPGQGAHPSAFGRHVDRETGVAPWFAPCETSYDFVYAGTGKKSGY